MSAILRVGGQFLVIVALFAAVAALSDRPIYRQIPLDSGIVILSFVHGSDRRADCRRLTPEELAKLAPNMRRVEDCPRRRRPVDVELEVDGHTIYRASLSPSGIAGDGPSRVYERFVLPSGRHELAVRMRDTPRTEGFDHEKIGVVELAPDQLYVIDYRAASAEFIFR